MSFQFESSGQLKALTLRELEEADRSSGIVMLDTGTIDDGTPYWAYISVKPSKYHEYMDVTSAKKPRRLDDYGTILKYGYEAQVPHDIQESFKREHDFSDDPMSAITQTVLEAQGMFLKKKEERRIGNIVEMLKKQKYRGE